MSDPESLAALRAQIHLATLAAERLVRDARREPPGDPAGPTPPPSPPAAGWQPSGPTGAETELAALGRLLELLREVLPAELEQQVTDLVHQLLAILRALIDWAATRLEPEGRGREVPVEDIPID